jgi:hypothetical protein
MWLFLAPLIRSPSCRPAGDACIIARPAAGTGAILDLGRPIADRDGIDDLRARLACRRRGFAPAHDPAAAQMRQKLLLEHAPRLNEQAFADRFMWAQSWRNPWDAGRSATRRSAVATIAQAAFGRSERTGADWMPAGKACVGGRNPTPARRRGWRDTPGIAIAGDAATDRGGRPSETSADLSAGEPINKAPRYLLPLRQAERSPLARPRRRRKAPVRRDDAEH